MLIETRIHRARSTAKLLVAVSALAACSGGDTDAAGDMEPAAAEEPVVPTAAGLVELLRAGQPVFGIFSGDHTPEQGARMAGNRETDFVFYSLESGPFDIPGMVAYMRGMASSDAGAAHPVALRIPPIRDGHDEARERVRVGLEAGASVLVFPHVENADEARVAVSSMGEGVWPADPVGSRLNVLIIEDRVGIENARDIVSTPGVSVAIPGPGDLRRAFDGDMVAVEAAIQTVLAQCLELDVPCGITAGADDIAERLDQGFRFIIVTEPEALAVGRSASGRAG